MKHDARTTNRSDSTDPQSAALDDPTHHIVAMFGSEQQAREALATIIALGLAASNAVILNADSSPTEIDTSAKWFADTDQVLQRFQEAIRANKTVLYVPEPDADRRDEMVTSLKASGAELVTHFGQWLTESF